VTGASVAILAVGATVSASCALVGTFLVLRRTALLGDAISHAVLPGIAIAFMLTGSLGTIPMVIGAGALGVVTVFLVQALTQSRRMREDASIGVVFPALFALGVILISRYVTSVDLDLECVLYGEIAYAPLDVVEWGDSLRVPRGLLVSGAILLADLALVLLLYKELELTSFDPELAAALGFSPALVHYSLMSAVSVTVVGSFESVGAILVVAMLVAPPATAYLLTDRLSRMLALAVGIGVASTVSGYFLASALDASIAGGMAVAAGVLFVLAWVLSPRHGLVVRVARSRALAHRLDGELLLLHLKDRARALPLDAVALRFGWRESRLLRVVAGLAREGLVRRDGEGLAITPEGALRLERAGTAPLAHAG
jgi:manganese/zinc/iron transport system permease protein